MTSSFRPLSILFLALPLLTVLQGCGGSEPTTPPPPEGAPASIVIHAGDGQSADPATAVAVNPAVRVLDAAGKPLSGIVVNFSVDSGGGSIGSSTASTGTNGVASPGRWILGSGGPQVLGAKVGALPRLKIRATIKPPDNTLTIQTVSAGGGTITVSQPGSALNGLVLTLPNGALSGSSTISLTEVATSGFTLPTGVTAVSPALGITSTAGTLRLPALLQFPRSATTSGTPAIALRNATTGAVTILPPIAIDATTITVGLSALNGNAVPSLRATGSLLGALRDDPKALVFQVAIDPALLNRDFDSGFRPGADDWDFARQPVASLAFLQGGGQSQTAVDPADGMVATSLWYYVHQRNSGGPLSGKFQLQAGEPESNRDGIRWSAIATSDVPDLFITGGITTAWEEEISLDAAGFAAAQFTGIKTMFLLGFERPVPVLLFTSEDDNAPRMGIAYRTVGDNIDIAVPDNPGVSYRASYTSQGMTPFTIVGVNQLTYVVRAVAGLHYAMVVKDGALGSQWGRVSAGTIGKSEGWPNVTLHFEDGALDTAAVFLADTLRHWWECDGCTDYGYRPSTVPGSASHVQQFRKGAIENGSFEGLGPMFGSLAVSSDDIPGTADTQKTGFAIYLPGPGSSGSSSAAPGWLAWNTVTYKRMKLQPSPTAVEVKGDTTVTFVVAPTPAPPTGTRYAWVLRTDEGRDSMETAIPTHTRDLEAGTDGMLLIMALEPGTRRVIGKDSVAITSDGPAPFWHITSVGDPDGLFDGTEASGPTADLLKRLLASPASAMLAIEPSGSGNENIFYLKVLRSGVWNAADCCPPVAAGALMIQRLGTAPATSNSVGPFFAAWASSYWTQSNTDLGLGTMNAQDNFGLVSQAVKDAGMQVGPAGAIRLTATRNDKAMTGIIGIYIWDQNEKGEAYGPPDLYQLPFTATRMR